MSRERLVNIGYLDAASSDGDGTALDLGALSVGGNLARITAGTALPNRI